MEVSRRTIPLGEGLAKYTNVRVKRPIERRLLLKPIHRTLKGHILAYFNS